MIGCLTLKPQLGVLIAVALLAAGLWRTIFAATATALVLAVLPTLAAGLKYWPMFFDRVSEQGDRLLGAIGATDLMVGTFYLMVRLGLPAELALTVQTGLALACVFAVAFVWRSGRVSLDTKAAALLAAIFLSAPYLWFYEAALMAATGLFLLRAGLIRQTPQHLALLFLLWLGAGIQAITVFLGQGDSGFPWAVIYVPVMATALVLCLLQLRSQPQPEPLAG
ncbi:MAG: glycosyltransferase 87 family protein [Tabrizicola sp.]|nr:glycosyltransferase 87 family protein [Tabrizicola sp.]